MMKIAISLLLLASAPAHARGTDIADARISEIRVARSGSARILTSTEVTQLVMLPLGQAVVSISLSDPDAYFANIAGESDMLSLRATRPNAAAILTVRTNQRAYDLELIANTGPHVASVIRLIDPLGQRVTRTGGVGGQSQQSGYRLSGSKSVLPTLIDDDGAKTYIEWAGDLPMPATFAIGPTGKEQMVEGYMRDGKFTIDRIYDQLVFRIDREIARATRNTAKTERNHD